MGNATDIPFRVHTGAPLIGRRSTGEATPVSAMKRYYVLIGLSLCRRTGACAAPSLLGHGASVLETVLCPGWSLLRRRTGTCAHHPFMVYTGSATKRCCADIGRPLHRRTGALFVHRSGIGCTHSVIAQGRRHIGTRIGVPVLVGDTQFGTVIQGQSGYQTVRPILGKEPLVDSHLEPKGRVKVISLYRIKVLLDRCIAQFGLLVSQAAQCISASHFICQQGHSTAEEVCTVQG